ncbi:MAG: helix-turn-helix transcriptional regulator [Clostridia bacterium]|nr:helix-turn-helix transcriptional regulator [Clostridia bacterium]MDE6471948.1 helix-turn-helix transcriptional regulator [Clostridia bacterium]
MIEKEVITINYALALRIRELLKLKNMSQYRLEQNSGVSHSQLGFILKNRNNSVNFKTVIMLAKGFDMTLLEFLDSPYFDCEKLEIE